MTYRLRHLIGLATLAFALIVRPQPAAAHDLCFPADKTPHCLNEPFSDYWEANGGLPVFGYPVTAAAAEANAATGQTYLTQWVERTRLEDHPENAGTPYRVLLGLLGKERLQQLGRDPGAAGREAGPQAGCLWFEQTGHNVCNIEGTLGFKQYWESHGLKIAGLSDFDRSLQLFGLPLTAPQQETNASGDTVLTQWFERARFEWHPGNPDEYKVLLGLLGGEVLQGRSVPAPAPIPQPDPCAGIPAPSAGGQILEDCIHAGDAFTALSTSFIRSERVLISLTGPDGAPAALSAIIGDGVATSAGHYQLKAALAPYSPPGDYVLAFEGVKSELRVTIPFRILAGPPSGADQTLLPASSNGSVDPTSGPRGTEFSFKCWGFDHLEKVAVYVTDPAGTAIDGFQVKANKSGDACNNIYLRTGQTIPLGIYAVTLEGLDHGHKAILYLRVNP